MAKIGIVTFHCANNYGAVLQAYGLQEFLKEQGHEVYIIDYKPKVLVKMYSKHSIRHWASRNLYKCIKRLIAEIKIKRIRIERWNNFDAFRKKMFSLYPFKKDYEYSDFDYIILGSDQVWNSGMVGGIIDDVYWGKFFNCNVISYAASSRKINYSLEEIEYIKSCLNHLKSISVREESLKSFIQPLTSNKVEIVLDPTLLAGQRIFDNISVNPQISNYLLLYEIGRKEKTRQIAEYIANYKHLKIIELVNSPIKNEKHLDQTASPQKFIGYIKNATFVVTTSFHGVALSFLFKRDFYAIKQNTSADDRIESFLNQVMLNDRFINDISEVDVDNCKIDFSLINNYYTELRNCSVSFLKNAID